MEQRMKSKVPMVSDREDAIDWTKIDTQIDYEGKKIVLPDTPDKMPIDNAIETLKALKKQESQKFDVNELVFGAPHDALLAVLRAMQDIYGVVISEGIQTFFGEIRPDFITVKTGVHTEVQVPMGNMQLPGADDPINVSMFPSGVSLRGTVRKKDRARLIEIAAKAKEIMRTNSIYRGQAISLEVDENGDVDLTGNQPPFIDLENIHEDDIIHTADVTASIRTNIFALLKNTVACRKHRIPLKRGILLEGRYGTGKTLTALVTARIATDNGWTYIMLNRAQGLKSAIELAKRYQPAVIFAEDIDRHADRDEETVNDLVNTMDGILSKDNEIMVVLTTNFIDDIDPSILRPGRFDAIISLADPDAETAIRLVKKYAGSLLSSEVDLVEVGEVLVGQTPATIREVVERAKLSMLVHDRRELNTNDLKVSALGMRRHLELLNPKEEKESTSLEAAFRALIKDVINGPTEGEYDGDFAMLRKRVDTQANESEVRDRKILNVAAAGAHSSKKTLDIIDESAKHQKTAIDRIRKELTGAED